MFSNGVDIDPGQNVAQYFHCIVLKCMFPNGNVPAGILRVQHRKHLPAGILKVKHHKHLIGDELNKPMAYVQIISLLHIINNMYITCMLLK